MLKSEKGATSPPCWPPFALPLTLPVLEVKLQCCLSYSRVAGTCYETELRGSHVSARVHELRVVKPIEELNSEFRRESFPNTSHLLQREVPVVQSRSMKEAAVGVACNSDRLWGK